MPYPLPHIDPSGKGEVRLKIRDNEAISGNRNHSTENVGCLWTSEQLGQKT
jgi:hypothetical protein